MNLMDLFVKVGVDDQASKKLPGISDGFKKVGSAIGKGLATAAKVGVAVVSAVTTAATAMTAAFIKGTSEVAQYGDNIDKMSQKMGLSAQAYQEWDFIMQHSGTSIESLQAGMKTLANAVENDNEAFKRLGLSQKEIAKMSNEELFSATISALQNVENETERTYLAGQLLGRGATELGALLNTSAEDTEAMRQQVHELGGVMSNEAIKAAAAYQDSLQNMQTAFSGIQRGMLSEFLPSMVSVMDGLALIFSGNDSGIAKITEGVNQFANKLMEAVPKIFELGQGILSSLATAILDNLPTLTSTASKVIVQLFAGIVSALPVLAEGAIEIAQSLATGLSENLDVIIQSAVDLISVLADGIINMLPDIIALGLDLIVSLAMGIAESLPELIPTVVDVVLQIVETLTNPETLTSLLDAAIAIIMAIANYLLQPDTINMLLNAAIGVVRSLVSFLMQNLSPLLNAAISLIMALVNYLLEPDNLKMLVSMALELILTIAGALVGASGELMAAAGQLILDLINKFKETDWMQLGKDIIEGMKQGIQDAWNNLKEWFEGLFGDIIQIAKDILGIASPSKVFKKLGGFTAEGFGLGFDDEFANVKDDMENAMAFDDVEIGANIHRSGSYGGVGSLSGGNSFGDVIINIDGARYSDEQSLAVAVAEALQTMTDRKVAVYA